MRSIYIVTETSTR